VPPPPPPPPPRQGFNWGAFFGGTLFGCGCLPFVVIVLFFTAIGAMFSRATPSSSGPSRPSVGLINISGIITSGEPDGGLFGGAGADAQRIIDQLETARKSPNIRSVVMYINSPGGSAAGSDAVYTEVQRVRASGKTVVTAMGDMAASGGYYIASASDRIYANGATLTGSIGVITELANFSDPNGWIQKSGYRTVVVKSGKYKDMGNPFRPIRPEERQLFQQMVNDIYGQFLSAVSKGRGAKMPLSKLKPLADGRVFTGRQAVNNGLVDEIGTLQDAIAYAAKQGRLKGEPSVYQFKENPFRELFGGAGASSRSLLGKSTLGLLLLDPRAQELARGLAGQPAELSAR
jgi:protease-4